MATSKEFNTAGEALCYMIECTMASLEHAQLVKSTPKNEIARLSSIIEAGLHACRKFNLREDAHHARCYRVESALQ